MAILSDFDEFREPIFCSNNDIAINNKNDCIVMFSCKLLKIVKFDCHFKAYNE